MTGGGAGAGGGEAVVGVVRDGDRLLEGVGDVERALVTVGDDDTCGDAVGLAAGEGDGAAADPGAVVVERTTVVCVVVVLVVRDRGRLAVVVGTSC